MTTSHRSIHFLAFLLVPVALAFVLPLGTQAHDGARRSMTPVSALQIEAPTDTLAGGLISKDHLDGLVRYAMEAHHLPGVVVSIVHNDRLVLAKGWGHAQLGTNVPVDPARTLFRVASISKIFTFTGIMQLVETGQLELDQNISTYLEDVEVAGTEQFGPLTMTHLMTHTPGFEDTYVGHFYADSPTTDYPRTFYLNRYQPTRVRPPGEIISYSNYGVALAGKVLEDISGKAFADYMDQHVLHPIGMTRSSFRDGPRLDRALARARATAYQWSGGRYQPFEHHFLHRGKYPAGALSTTAVDMARYMRAHLNGGAVGGTSLLRPETTAEMHRVLIRNADGIMGNAHGFWAGTIAGYATLEHGGAALGFHSNLVLIPELDLGIFVSTNGEAGRSFAARLPRMIVRTAFPPTSRLPDPDSSLMDRADIYAGTYLGTRRGYTTIDKMHELSNGMAQVSVTASGHLVITGLGDVRRYRPAGDHRFVNVDTERAIAFEVTDGRASGLMMATEAFERIGFWQTAQAFQLVMLVSFVVLIGTLIGFWIRRGREIEQTAAERWASGALGATAVCWLVSIGILLYRLSTPAGPERADLVHFPPDLLVAIALWGTLISAVLTSISLLGLIPVWRHRSWGMMRALRHTGIVAIMAVLTLMLWQWNAIGVQVTGS